MIGQTARFERYITNLLYVVAAGRRIDPDIVEPFIHQVEDVYRNPFKEPEKPMTAEEIKQYILRRLQE